MANKKKDFFKRISFLKIIQFIFMLLMGVLVLNIFYLASTGKHFISGKNIADYAKNNRSETTRTIKADRGSIYSYDGEPLIVDRIAYNVTAYINSNRKGTGGKVAYVDKPELASKVLKQYVGLDESAIYTRLTQSGWETTFKCYLNSVEVKQLTEELKVNEINGIEFEKTSSRSYMYKHFSSYLLGLVNTNDDDPRNVVRTGAFGIEANYNDYLKGTDGEIVYQADSSGHAIYGGVLSETPAENGSTIYLSLDSELQNMLETKLDEAMQKSNANKMWCGFMDAKTGRMLAMASRPDFDLTDRSSLENWTDLFLNYSYEVGSVVKPFVYLSAIDQGVYQGDETYASGKINVKKTGAVVNDWNQGRGWGMITYDEGLVRSSNTAIVNLIQDKINFDDYTQKLDALGFFKESQIDGFNVAGGVAAYKNTESPFDKVSLGFGQASTYSPMQILKAYSVFANGGRTVEPYFVDRIIDVNNEVSYTANARKYSEQIFSEQAIKHVNGLMSRVINDDIGTGKTYKMEGTELTGKTGTGQLYDASTGGYSRTQYTYTFAGCAPANDPQVVVFIGMEGKESYDNAGYLAEVVSAIMPQALKKLNPVIDGEQTQGQTQDLVMDSYVNQSVEFATRRLDELGVAYKVIGDGAVVKRQSVPLNTTVSKSSTIYLLTDAKKYTLPDFTGWSRKDVASYMQLFDISVYFNGVGHVKSQNIPKDTDMTEVNELTIELEN